MVGRRQLYLGTSEGTAGACLAGEATAAAAAACAGYRGEAGDRPLKEAVEGQEYLVVAVLHPGTR